MWILIVAAGAISFHLIRLFEHLAFSSRGHLWLINVLLPTHLLNFIFPYLFDVPLHPESNFFFAKVFTQLNNVVFHSDKIQCISPPYIGILGISLVQWSWRGRGPFRFYAGVVTALIFYMMTFPILAPVYKHIPILAQLPRLGRLNSVFTFALAVLAGIGFDRYLFQKPGLKGITIFYGTISVAAVAVFACLRLIVNYQKETIRSLLAEFIKTHILTSSQYKAPLDFYLKRIDEFFVFISQWTDFKSPSVTLPIVLIFLTLLLLHLWKRGTIQKRLFMAGCVLLLLADILIFFRLSASTVFADPKMLVSDTGSIRFLKAEAKKEVFRIAPILENVEFGVGRTRDDLTPNLNLIYGFASVEGYNGLVPKNYSKFIKTFQTDYDKDPDLIVLGQEKDFDHVLADFLNVKYFLAKKDQKLTRNMPVVFEDDRHKVYFNPSYYPRAFLVQNYMVGKNEAENLAILKKQKGNLRNVVVLEEEPILPRIDFDPLAIEDRVVIEKYTPNQIKIKTFSRLDSFLVLTDNYFPGWAASLDRKPTKILKADFSFRAVEVPQGIHAIEFNYDPESWRMGLWTSSFFVACGVLVLIVWMRNRKVNF